MATVRFFFDYVDPAAWLVERALADAEAALGLGVERVPFELTPPPAALVDPTTDAWRGLWDEARATAAEEGVALAEPRIVPWTRKAHELALHAREEGCGPAVHEALFRTFLLEGRDIGRVDVLLGIATGSGLDATRAKAVLDVDRHTPAVERARAEAERLGVRGVPTLLSEFGTLEGFRGRRALLDFLERAAAR